MTGAGFTENKSYQRKEPEKMKEKFIKAYQYCYGATRKEAEKAFREATPAYIAAIIESMNQDAHRAFYND